MKTDCLHDEGEESWERKLHLGCGGIYVSGYMNVDIDGAIASQHRDLVERNQTTLSDYYARLNGTLDNLPSSRETVADLLCDFSDLPYRPGSVDKIVAIQSLEHVHPDQGRRALNHWWNLLKPGGVLILSVPDVPGAIQLLKSYTTLCFGIRHLEGSGKNEHSRHISWYSQESLLDLLTEFGFDNLQILPNIHLYPAVVVKARKLDRYVADRSYQYPLPEYDATCVSVLDVGPGNFPLPFATRCFDKDDYYQNSRLVPCDVGDIYHLPYPDDSYDYVYCSHCLEHLTQPAEALNELMRVGKRGYIEVPSAMLDYQCQHGHTKNHPYWMSLQTSNGLVMVEKSKDMQDAFTDDYVGAYMHRILQYPMALTKNEQDLRQQFWRNQRVLNVSASWNKGTGKVARLIEVRL